MKKLATLLILTVAATGAAVCQSAFAADCVISNLDAGKVAGLYQGGGQRLAELYNLTKSMQDDDVIFSLEGQGPLASFSDASYLIADLLKLRAGMTNERDRAAVDADIRANLELAGPAFHAAADYLSAMAPKAQNTELKSALVTAAQFVNDGIAVYGACVKAAPHS